MTDAAPLQTIVEDPGPPYLFVDLYPFDVDNPHTPKLDDVPWPAVLAEPQLYGAILKATDGIYYGKAFALWFRRNFEAQKSAAGSRYGSSWFRGAYHYLQFAADGAAQADAYCNAVEAAGGWDDGTIMPIVDVELGGERSANRRATGAGIMACVQAFAARAKQRTGRRVMLYGRGAMRDLNIASRMGCDVVWNPSYTASMARNGLTALPSGKLGPWRLDDIVLWQYCGDGDGDASKHRLPLRLKSLGKVDLSVHVNGEKKPSLATLRAALI